MMKIISKIALLLISLNLIYIIVDLIHFFRFRLNVIYSLYREFFYETTLESSFKWAFSILSIFFIYKASNANKKYFYFLITVCIAMIVYFFLNGSWVNLTDGSLVHKINLIYIIAIISLFYSLFNLLKNDRNPASLGDGSN